MKDRGFYVMDIEQFAEFHCSVWFNIDTKVVHKFVISHFKDDRIEYFKFLKNDVNKIIGFNILNYDYPVIHCLLQNTNVQDIVKLLRLLTKLSLQIIHNDSYSSYIQYKKYDVVDLFKIWHYDNAARRTSLKVLQCSMNYPNVESFDFNTPVNSLDDVNKVLHYCENDVMSTYRFFELSLDKIRLRQQLKKQFKGFDCINYSDSLLGEKLLLYFYEKETGITESELRAKQKNYLYPSFIRTKDILFDYIHFKTEHKQALFECFQQSTIGTFPKLKLNVKAFENKQKNRIHVEYTSKKQKIYQISDGLEYYFGAGGIHSSRQGSFYSTDTHIIKDIDVTSLYPNIADKNNVYPVMLGEKFSRIYREKIIEVRTNSKSLLTKHKKGISLLTVDELTYHNIVSDGYKLAANSVYGKSNDENSVLRDPIYTGKTTINGQLLIYMLCEDLEPLGKIIQANTDGITILIERTKEEQLMNICHDWEMISRFSLEYDEYQSMHIRDVNNYIGIKFNGSTKEKGAYEVDKVTGNEPSFHKDNSFRIVPYTVREYFKHGTEPIEVIMNHDNIYDFLGREKFNKDSKGYLRYYGNTEEEWKGDLFGEVSQLIPAPSVSRYFVSNEGYTFHKIMNKTPDKISRINVGYQVKLCQDVEDTNPKQYDINYNFYVNEALKLINNI